MARAEEIKACAIIVAKLVEKALRGRPDVIGRIILKCECRGSVCSEHENYGIPECDVISFADGLPRLRTDSLPWSEG